MLSLNNWWSKTRISSFEEVSWLLDFFLIKSEGVDYIYSDTITIHVLLTTNIFPSRRNIVNVTHSSVVTAYFLGYASYIVPVRNYIYPQYCQFMYSLILSTIYHSCRKELYYYLVKHYWLIWSTIKKSVYFINIHFAFTPPFIRPL